MIRIVENNDWVTAIVIGGLLIITLVYVYLNREVSLKEYLTQDVGDASNVFLTWTIMSIVFFVQMTVLMSQYIPSVPKVVEDIQIGGYQLNKFGYLFGVISLFYLVKTVLSFFFYASINQIQNYQNQYFVASRFYFCYIIVLIILIFINYYIGINKRYFLLILLAFNAIMFLFKLILYLFHKNKILPNQWYYKFLYICTLQIAPLYALWRLLFYN